MKIIDWINCNSTFINLLSTLIVAIATVFYVILTLRLVSESIKNRRLQIDPKIVMNILPDEYDIYFLNFIIENVGNGVALNIKFNINNEYNVKTSKKLSDYIFIQNGLKTLSGKTKYKSMFSFTIEEDLQIFKEPMIINIEYEDIYKRKYFEKIMFDLSYLSDISRLRNRPEDKILKELKDVSKSLKNISHNISEIKKNY